MPIAAGLAPLQAQITAALNLDIAATPTSTATMISAATATAVSMGLYQLGSPPIPPITPPPAGLAAMQSSIEAALNLNIAGNEDLFATLFATGVASLSPIVPPSGFSLLQSQVSSALSLDIAGNPSLFASIVAPAIISYYTAGGVF